MMRFLAAGGFGGYLVGFTPWTDLLWIGWGLCLILLGILAEQEGW
jgi:hypothetical protein